jgi:hypothetical protein
LGNKVTEASLLAPTAWMVCRSTTPSWLTSGFAKKWENHQAALALFFGYYNFCRVHSTSKTTPAVKAGLAERPWTVRELLSKVSEFR